MHRHKDFLTPSQAKLVLDYHARSRVATHCPSSSVNWIGMFEAQIKLDDVAEVEIAPAPADAIDMRVTAKKGIGFYVKATSAFFQGTDAKPAVEGKDVVEAKPPVEHVWISGVGEGAGRSRHSFGGCVSKPGDNH